MMAFNMTGINMIDLFWDIGQISNLKIEIILNTFLDYSRVKLELYQAYPQNFRKKHTLNNP